MTQFFRPLALLGEHPAPPRPGEGAVARLPVRAWRGLERAVAPADVLSDPVLLLRARFLAGFSLAQVALSSWSAVSCWLFSPGLAPVVSPVCAGFAALALGTYAAARSRHVERLVWPIVALQFWPHLAATWLLPASTLSPPATAAWLVPFLIIASILVGTRGLLVLAAAVSAIVVLALVRSAAPASVVWEALSLYGIGASVTYFFARHHEAVEGARRAVLLARNDELEELRRTLEDRVARRTHELEVRRNELAATNEALHKHQDALVQSEKLAVLGRLTAGIAHEMASPLAAILGVIDEGHELQAEYLGSIDDAAVTADDHRAIAAEMRDVLGLGRTATERLSLFVRKLRSHTRDPGPLAAERFGVRAVIDESCALVAHTARASGVRLRVEDRSEGAELLGVPGRLGQVIVNLLGNAIDATVEARTAAGEVVVELSASAGEVRLAILDDGTGIADHVFPRLFEPLFTTKPHGLGTGLGLVIVEQIVRGDFGGVVNVANRPSHGAMFTLVLPRTGGRP